MFQLICDFCGKILTNNDMKYMGYNQKTENASFKNCHCPSCSQRIIALIREGEYDNFIKERYQQLEKDSKKEK